MVHTACGVCFSLNKSISYLSLCLSLNSFCHETSRTWASKKKKNLSFIKSWNQVLWVLAGFEHQPHEFKSPSEVNSFTFTFNACQCRRLRFHPWVGKIPWRRKWPPTPVLLPGEPHGHCGLQSIGSQSPVWLGDWVYTNASSELNSNSTSQGKASLTDRPVSGPQRKSCFSF